jgi:hypothetical protein
MKPALITCLRVDKRGYCASIGKAGILAAIYRNLHFITVVVSAEKS